MCPQEHEASSADAPLAVLTDEEAETIPRKLAEGWRGPVLLRRLEQFLQDRNERRRREREAEAEKPPPP